MANHAEIGTTFSPVQCRYLGLDEDQTKQAFRETLDFVNVIRLGANWDEVQANEGEFDFRTLDWQLNEALRRGIKVILVAGVKVPRYPEYFFPGWLKERFPEETVGKKGSVDSNPRIADLTTKFVARVVEHARDVEVIKVWQVENEPLVRVPFANHMHLSRPFVEEEVRLVRSLMRGDQRILLTMSANLFPIPVPGYDDNSQFKASSELADEVGFNVYTRVAVGTFFNLPLFRSLYMRPLPGYFWNKLERWNQELEGMGKNAWIVEAQAEPWEAGGYVHTAKREYPSSNPKKAAELAIKLKEIGYDKILLWGVEHWYRHKLLGNMEWWDGMRSLIEGMKS